MTEPQADLTAASDAVAQPTAPVPGTSGPAGPTAGRSEIAEEPADLDGGDASLLGLVDRLAAVLERSDLLELEIQSGATALILRRPEALSQVVTVGPGSGQAGAQGVGGESGAGAGHPEAPAEPVRSSVKAPLTGIWYSAPSPGSAPFVHVGGEVAVGQVIGLIEAMKLFNEIKSDLAGRVVRVPVESGQLVKAKQPLLEVEPL
ncbi:MAG TPA: biotin/lipoyl-containing protein [Candidatus Dormibacteraeota bacterium]|nr:biotin/lipoyl-containing protein [Candidatus Dormibacteraeota bacterium]